MLFSGSKATYDGMSGLAEMIEPGHSFTYDFIAQPARVDPYHYHMFPVEEHVSRGLYGMMIIDPPTPRPHAIYYDLTTDVYQGASIST